MSYAQKKEIGGNRTLAIIMVVVVQFALGYAIVTGLAYNIIKKASENLKTFEVEEQPPPPEKPPPPPKDMPKVPPPPMMPPPIMRMNSPPPPIQVVELPITRRLHPPVAPPAPPPPPQPRKVESARARGDVRTLFSSDDYPASAQSAGAEGSAQAQLTIGPTAAWSAARWSVRPATARSILRPATSCAAAPNSRPARDSNGNPTTDTYTTPTIVWRLEG